VQELVLPLALSRALCMAQGLLMATLQTEHKELL